MNNQEFLRTKIYVTALVILYVWGLLTWQYFHGGVPSHYILHRSDLPSFSNWWGGLVLPILTWFLVDRIHKRETEKYSTGVMVGFFGALLYGIVLSISFVNGFDQFASFMSPGLLVIAFFFPIYRAEYLLGFIISMSYTFGVLLPSGFGAVVALLAFILYNYIRPIVLYLLGRLKNVGKT